jgi:hypothetical protein
MKGAYLWAKKSKVLRYGLSTAIFLIVAGLIWSQFAKTKNSPIDSTYEITSLPSGYTLSSADIKEFNHKSYAVIRYKGQPQMLPGGLTGVYYIDLSQFKIGDTVFNPPSNCGFTHPIDPTLGEKAYGKRGCWL